MTTTVRVGAGLVLMLTACGGTAGEGGSCAAPTFTASPAAAQAGDSIKLKGSLYVNGCHDNSIKGTQPETTTPLRGVRLWLVPAEGVRTELAQFDAVGELGTIDGSFTLPESVKVGQTYLVLGTAEPVEFTVSP